MPNRRLVGMVVVTFAIGWCLATGGALTAQEPAQEKPEQGPTTESGAQTQAGFLAYSGGPARGKRAITQTAATTFPERGTWSALPGALLPWVIPTGNDLINLAFSAECRLFNGGGDDYLRIRILYIQNGVPQGLVEPYDGAQAFCSADGYATHKGNWARRVGAGTHQFQVQVWIFDGAPAEVVTAWLDDWTFELVSYD